MHVQEGNHAPDVELEALCQSCGLCCDGSLFGRVPLDADEAPAARKNRLPVLAGGGAFEQPCAALAADAATDGPRRTCSIYAERPRACRRFSCRLYDRHRREGGALEPRLDAVRRVRAIVARLEASGLGPSDFDGAREAVLAMGPLGEPLARAHEELARRLEADFARAEP